MKRSFGAVLIDHDSDRRASGVGTGAPRYGRGSKHCVALRVTCAHFKTSEVGMRTRTGFH
jgi:hypothetical protein